MKGIKNLSQLVSLVGIHQKNGRKVNQDDLGIIPDGAVVWDKDKILWSGKSQEIPSQFKDSVEWSDGSGHILTPEIVDSHTHTVFGGNRAQEYTMKINGEDYQKIAAAGGGILATMHHTNKASKEELFKTAVERIQRIHSYGVGSLEIKSGYGLNVDKEVECAEIIASLKDHFKGQVQIFNTFMPAHAIPPEYKDGKSYLKEVVYPAIDKVLKKDIIDGVDIFHEVGYFNHEETEEFFKHCQNLGLSLKIHADEFHDNGGAKLAAKYNALSCDHLLRTEEAGIEALSQSDTVATVLPGTGFFLGKPQANARALIDGGAKVAMASDYNPGSCHCDNLLLIASLAAPTLKMSLSEIWCAMTYNAAHALGFKNQGAIKEGLKPRFSYFQVEQVDEITYHWGRNFAKPVP